MSRHPLPTLVLSLLVLLAPAGVASSQTTTAVDQVEEDWEVVIGVPDPAGAGPQINTGMSPVSDGSTPEFYFSLNYRESPSFAAGGLQVQVWDGLTLLATDTSNNSSQLSTSNEKITWTQRMKVASGTVNMSVLSGRSTTWGNFGQGQSFTVKGSLATTLTSLSGYTPSTSISKSAVGWERNRVTSMALVQVRYYSAGKLISTDKTRRSVSLSGY